MLITAVAVLPGNTQDHERALELVEQSEAATGGAVAETLADGDGQTRQTSVDRGHGAERQGPAEDAWYQRSRALLQEDPDWEDGEIIFVY